MELSKDEQKLLEFFRAANSKGKRTMIDYAKFVSICDPKNVVAHEVLAHKMANKKKS